MSQMQCLHDPTTGCDCSLTGSSTAQRLEELEFSRSACSASQLGQVDKLERILNRNPDAVHGRDSASGEVNPRAAASPC